MMYDSIEKFVIRNGVLTFDRTGGGVRKIFGNEIGHYVNHPRKLPTPITKSISSAGFDVWEALENFDSFVRTGNQREGHLTGCQPKDDDMLDDWVANAKNAHVAYTGKIFEAVAWGTLRCETPDEIAEHIYRGGEPVHWKFDDDPFIADNVYISCGSQYAGGLGCSTGSLRVGGGIGDFNREVHFCGTGDTVKTAMVDLSKKITKKLDLPFSYVTQAQINLLKFGI